LILAALAAIWGFAVFRYGGVLRLDWNICLLALGLLAIAYTLVPRADRAPAPEAWLRWLLVLLPAYVAFQILPLPAAALRVLSPVRIELLEPGSSFAPLSVVPSATLQGLLTILAYVVVFLLIRQVAWRHGDLPWIAAAPIIAVAVVEASLGLLQRALGPADTVGHGTYANRDHFAGLLGMSLPFPLFLGVAIYRRAKERTLTVILACALFGAAAVILLGILSSLSRMGFLSALGCLFFAGFLALASAASGAKRAVFVAILGIAVAAAFLLLPSDLLIGRYAEALTAEGRPLIWKSTFGLIRNYVLFGCGLGGYESAFFKFSAWAPLQTVDAAHNDYLQSLAELGIVGSAIIGALFVGLFVEVMKFVRSHSEPDGKYLAMACASSMVAIALHSFADFNLYIPANGFLLAWVCGMASSLRFSSKTLPVWGILKAPAVWTTGESRMEPIV
jgi:O-antigen ligase